jgi:hypothetical protein
MSIDNFEFKKKLEDLNDLDLHFLYTRLLQYHWLVLRENQTSITSNEEKISRILNHQNYAHRKRLNFEVSVDEILSQRVSSKIPKENLDWIDPSNYRQCIFVWIVIRNIFTPSIGGLFKYISDYEDHLMTLEPSTASRCCNLALNFMYIWSLNLDYKLQKIAELERHWQQNVAFKHKMLKFIEKGNDETSAWLISYLSCRYQSFPKVHLFFNTFKEKKPLTLALIDSWFIPDAEKTIALDKAYTAAHGKKFNGKPKNLKGANFWLGAEQVRMLSEIAKKKKLSEKDLLNSLINDTYLHLLK